MTRFKKRFLLFLLKNTHIFSKFGLITRMPLFKLIIKIMLAIKIKLCLRSRSNYALDVNCWKFSCKHFLGLNVISDNYTKSLEYFKLFALEGFGIFTCQTPLSPITYYPLALYTNYISVYAMQIMRSQILDTLIHVHKIMW